MLAPFRSTPETEWDDDLVQIYYLVAKLVLAAHAEYGSREAWLHSIGQLVPGQLIADEDWFYVDKVRCQRLLVTLNMANYIPAGAHTRNTIFFTAMAAQGIYENPDLWQV
jgi:hypothetical protein